jgi:hypothetical protein
MSAADRVQGGFFILAFALHGECVGEGYWQCADLSAKWLAICREFLGRHTGSFEDSWSGNLSHIRTRITQSSDAAIVTFQVGDRVVSSILLLSGSAPTVDSEVAMLFVQSLRKTAPVLVATQSADPFNQILSKKDRPLMAVVAWPDAEVSAQDHELVHELGLHLAGAFFRGGQD